MTALLRAELLKLRTTRTFVAMTAVTVGTSVLLTGLVASLTEPTKASVIVDVFLSDTSGLFILVLAVVGMGGEWRHRTIAGALLATPDRVRFLAAKTLAFAAAGVAAVARRVARGDRRRGRDPVVPRPAAAGRRRARSRRTRATRWSPALLGALGVGVGALARNQVVGDRRRCCC